MRLSWAPPAVFQQAHAPEDEFRSRRSDEPGWALWSITGELDYAGADERLVVVTGLAHGRSDLGERKRRTGTTTIGVPSGSARYDRAFLDARRRGPVDPCAASVPALVARPRRIQAKPTATTPPRIGPATYAQKAVQWPPSTAGPNDRAGFMDA